MRDKTAKGRHGAHKLRGVKRGPSPMRGARHPRSKLTWAKVREIRELARRDVNKLPRHYRWKGKLNISAVAQDMGVSESLVRGVITGRNWSWFEDRPAAPKVASYGPRKVKTIPWKVDET